MERAKRPPAEKAGTRPGARFLEREAVPPGHCLCWLLALATLTVFLPVARQGFVNYDDSD